MKNRSAINALTQLILMWGVLVLSGCGGGSGAGGLSNGTSDAADRNFSSDQRVIQPTQFITGAGIKGPLAHATVGLYALDSQFPNLYDSADPLSTATTDAYAQIEGLPVPVDIAPPYILVIDGQKAIDLNTGVAPVITKLITVITQDALNSSTGIYATPYTTLAYHMLVKEFATGGFLNLQFTGGRRAIQQKSGGLVSFEAEDFDANVPRGGHQWIDRTTPGQSGTGTLAAMPDIGTNHNTEYVENSPRLDFTINFVKTGIHYVWIRAQQKSGGSDSVHVGLDNTSVDTANSVRISDSTLSWNNLKYGDKVVVINVATVGKHTLNIWMREDGAVLDKVILVTNANYVPQGRGPSANARQDTSIFSAMLSSKLSSFGQRIIDSAGFGMLAAIDVFSTPPIITAYTISLEEQQHVVQYRAAIEALSSLIYESSKIINSHVNVSDYLLELLANDLYDDDVINEFAFRVLAAGVFFQNPMTVQIANTAYQVKDIVALMDEERAYIAGASAVELHTNELYIDLRSLDPEVELFQNAVTAPIDDSSSVDTSPTSRAEYLPAKYLVEDFESSGWADRYTLDKNVKREAGIASRSGSYGLSMHVPEGEHWGGSIKFNHSRHGQKGNFVEVWSRYYVKFGPTWGSNDGNLGKAGYRARSDEVCGAPCLEMTDSVEVDSSGDVAGYSYFHRDVSASDVESKSFKYGRKQWASDALREREKWYCMETHHVLNTPGRNNGVYQNWVDGRLVSDHHSISHRNTETLNIDTSVLITYIGGDWRADRDMDIYFDDWAVSDNRIGCQ